MFKILEPYKEEIEQALEESFSSFGPKSRLRDAIVYALKNGGKRFRPALVLLIAKAIGKKKDAMDAALAIEYFHTASLIADDLPCMDNDSTRRNLPSLHVAFGESLSILATFSLISAGYDRIRLNAKKQNRDDLGMLAVESASFNTGILGASGGQFYDLFPPALSEETLLEIIDQKTGTLFEISFSFGWLFGGGDPTSLNLVKKAARHFGRAFQISDDWLDLEQDLGKLNFVSFAGRERAQTLADAELSSLKEGLKKLRLECPELLALIKMIEERIYASTNSFS